jgi:hypothetical protein
MSHLLCRLFRLTFLEVKHILHGRRCWAVRECPGRTCCSLCSDPSSSGTSTSPRRRWSILTSGGFGRPGAQVSRWWMIKACEPSCARRFGCWSSVSPTTGALARRYVARITYKVKMGVLMADHRHSRRGSAFGRSLSGSRGLFGKRDSRRRPQFNGWMV